MVKKAVGSPLALPDILDGRSVTYRNLIHEYLVKTNQPWSQLGIDILLGARLDKKITSEQSMFLPDYLMNGFDRATVGSRALVSGKQTVVTANEVAEEKSWFTPTVFFSIVLVCVLALSLLGTRWAQQVMGLFDRVLFFLLGLLGLLLITLWMIRVDTVCRDNFNLLWSIPSHIYIAFVLGQRKEWVKKYFLFTILISLLTGIAWFFLPQQMNPSLLPLLLVIIIRSYFRSKKP